MAALTLGFSMRVRGMRHVPRRGPVLFIANHQSYLDPVLVGLAVRRHLCYLARKTLFEHPAFAWLIRMLNAVPIDQEGTGIEGLRVTLQLLQAGRAVIVYPEGERTPDGAMRPFEPGITLLIKRTQAPVVPVGIAGAYDAWPRWRTFPMPSPLFLPATERTIAVAVGQPLDARRFVELPRQQMLDALFAELDRMHQQAERLRRKPRS
jgi:1-acyl-sn-glycerol-3-phosphate acyltransferase